MRALALPLPLPLPLPLRRLLALSLLLAGAACSRGGGSPLPAEFLIAAGDSTYWLLSAREGVRLRGSPIFLARFDDRFYEVYVADDDRSYRNAVIIGQRLYRRDLLTGDSVLVYEDRIISDIALRYARAHPDERPLAPEDDAAEEPETIATAELELLDLHGPYLSYEAHTDIDIFGEEDAHSVRRGVLDLRSGQPASLRSLFGKEVGDLLLRRGRGAFAAALDSVLAARGEPARRAARWIGEFEFDGTSFVLANAGRSPRVAFLVPGQRQRAGGLALPLPPLAVEPPSWWRDIEPTLPRAEGVDTDRWDHERYVVRARYSPGGDSVSLVLADTGRREWEAGVVAAPAHRIFWLDAPPIDSMQRRALARAFDEAALYSDDARVASAQRAPRRPAIVALTVSWPPAPNPPARDRPARHRRHAR